MKKRKILICDNEKEYARRLQEYLNENYSSIFETSLFTNEKSLNQFLNKETADVLLTSYQINPKNNNAVKHIIKLSGEKTEEDSGDVVYKYSPVKKIVAAVIELISSEEEPEETRRSERPIEIIGVYTPVKRCFQTTFCLCLGQIMAKKKKTLYLNFEGFSGFDYLSESTMKADIMDALYFAECGISSFALRVEAMAEKIGELRYISPTKAFTKLSSVTREQWKRLIDAIIEKTDYEVVIMDLSEQVNGLLDILDKCDRVYTIIDSERVAKAKVAQYQMLLQEMNYFGILSKTKSITIPRFREIPADFSMLPHSELTNYIRTTIYEEDANNVSQV